MSGDWRSVPTGDGLADYLNQQIALGKIGGTNPAVPLPNTPPDPRDWRTAATQFDGLCDQINVLIAAQRISTIPPTITAGTADSRNWRSAAQSTGDGLCDFINQQIALGRITVGVTPPGSPSLWFDAQNIDGTMNSSLIDGQAIGTWKNLGSIGSAGDVVQATAGNKPAFRLVAASGKINNKSAAEAIDNVRKMASGAFTSQNQPYVVAAVFRNNSGVGVATVMGNNAATTKFYSNAGGPMTMEVSGTNFTDGTPTVGSFHMMTGTVNGASSELRVNAASTLGTTGATAFGTAVCLFDSNAGQNMTGFLVEALFYFGGGTPTLASIETYFVSKYGAFPQ